MNNEYYRSAEQNNFGEYKHFQTEQYLVSTEISVVAEEISKPGHEYIADDKKTARKSNKKSNAIKKILDTVTKSVSNVVTTVVATVSTIAVAVVALTTLVTSPPEFQFFDIKTGNDFVEYRLELSDTKEGVDYVVSVENPYHSFERQVEEGNTKHLITGLKPDLEYSLILKGTGEDGESVTYHQSKLYTSRERAPNALFDVLLNEKNKEITYSVYISDGYGIADNCFLTATQNGEELYRNTDKDKGFFKGNFIYEIEENVKISAFGEINGNIVLIGEYLVYTKKDDKPLPEAFEGKFNIDSENTEVFWNEDGYNRIQIPVAFVTDDERINYRLRIKAQEDTFEPIDKGEYLEFLVPDYIDECFIEYRIFAQDGENEVVYEEQTLAEKINLAPSQVNITDIVLVGLNEFKIEFDMFLGQADASFQGLDLIITTDNSDELNIVVSDISKDIIFELPYGAEQISVKGELNTFGKYGNNLRTSRISEFTGSAEVALESEITYFTDFGYLDFIIAKGYLPLDGKIMVSDGNTETEYKIGEYISFEVPTGNNTYTYYALDGEGNTITSVYSFTTDSSASASVINSINPGDVLTTYNSDGTLNFYFYVAFEQQENTYYEIILGENEIVYKSTDYVGVISHAPNDSYGITYRVIKEINGIRHVVYQVTPSGTVGESRAIGSVVSGTVEGRAVALALDDYVGYDLSSVKIVSSTGETVILSEDDFTNEEHTYKAQFTLEGEAEFVIAYINANFSMSMYEAIIQHIQIEGDLYLEYAAEIY